MSRNKVLQLSESVAPLFALPQEIKLGVTRIPNLPRPDVLLSLGVATTFLATKILLLMKLT